MDLDDLDAGSSEVHFSKKDIKSVFQGQMKRDKHHKTYRSSPWLSVQLEEVKQWVLVHTIHSNHFLNSESQAVITTEENTVIQQVHASVSRACFVRSVQWY